jgi:hypothetical protein
MNLKSIHIKDNCFVFALDSNVNMDLIHQIRNIYWQLNNYKLDLNFSLHEIKITIPEGMCPDSFKTKLVDVFLDMDIYPSENISNPPFLVFI